MERLQKFLTRALVIFSLFSIGFVFGKHAVKPEAQTALLHAKGAQVVVYYLHSTFRCVTCNTMETMTKDLLESSYKSQLAAGEMIWVEDDFQKNDRLARQFEVIASCVVVVEMEDGEVLDYQRLDEVWTLMNDPGEFNQYIRQAIDGYLEGQGGGS
ncbi:nitrophenyl compound nitroreductase subunit ArsF family protein [Kiritimatiellaeota bacterium B1221]|nr:nitrophenyl compound nitroreductase subunit ArsF family protein [Kiritimatiellaeota bacterium B1221]